MINYRTLIVGKNITEEDYKRRIEVFISNNDVRICCLKSKYEKELEKLEKQKRLLIKELEKYE